MKKETVNTFSQGLNMDLNTIVTPNDVLTDNINGAFLTFNGDELSLQPDSGNTRIPIGTVGEVKLSDGFYPIGIKEYGGILYIVSAKDGEEKLIEFGSYPSPKYSNYEDKVNATLPLKITEDLLYQSQTISKMPFGTGVLVKFCSTGNISGDDIKYVWTPAKIYNPYILRVHLKLESGIIDLTENVWEQYSYFDKIGKAEHWIAEPDFVYRSPFIYKGLLSIQAVIDEPTFEFKQTPAVIGSNFQYSLNIKNTDSVEVVSWNISGLGELPSHRNVTSEIDIPVSGVESIFYTIRPNLRFRYYNVTVLWNDLPIELQTKYTLSGYLVLDDKVNNAGFELSGDRCLSGGNKEYTVAYLVGEGGYVDYNLESISSESNKLAFVKTGVQLPEDIELLGRYTIEGNHPKVIINPDVAQKFETGVYTTLVGKFESMEIFFPDDGCFDDTFEFGFSAPLILSSPRTLKYGKLNIYQEGVNSEIVWTSNDLGKTFICGIAPKGSLSIIFKGEYFKDVSITISEQEIRESLNNSSTYRKPIIPLFVNNMSVRVWRSFEDVKDIQIDLFSIYPEYSPIVIEGESMLELTQSVGTEGHTVDPKPRFTGDGKMVGLETVLHAPVKFIDPNRGSIDYRITYSKGLTIIAESNIQGGRLMRVAGMATPTGIINYLAFGNSVDGYLFVWRDHIFKLVGSNFLMSPDTPIWM